MDAFSDLIGLFVRIAASVVAAIALLVSLFTLEVTTPPEIVLTPDHPIIARDAMPDTWVATDGLGRTLVTNVEVGDAREDRFVGLFYWTWHVSHAQWVKNPINVQKIVSEYPQASHDLNFPLWGPLSSPHHWNEPLYGFYDTDDRWVLRRHAEMLAAAGVDVIIFDNTNGTFTWKNSYETVFEVFEQARADGVNTPKISFILPFSANDDTNTQLRELYNDIYRSGRYQDLWFYWKGKPLLMAHPDKLSRTNAIDREIRAFFSFRPANPDYKAQGKAGQWGWLSVYPQVVYKNRDGSVEQTTVGVAQNYSAAMGLTAMNAADVFGRTYTTNGYDPRENAKAYGANFTQQFEYALKVDPEFIFITGFNEWVAGRHEYWQGVVNAFPDQYNDEFSRDIEPSKGDLEDHYYYQMVDFIRRYKGVRQISQDTISAPLDICAGNMAWQGRGKTYYAYPGNTFDRDDVGYGGIRYTDSSGRNDLTKITTACDGEYLYFSAECASGISSPDSPRWMRLLLDTGNRPLNWNGYEFIINRVSPRGNQAVLERSAGSWVWEEAALVDYCVSDNRLCIKVPLSALGIPSEAIALNFKWSDNTLEQRDVMDFYLYGDTAPFGRFMYRYVCR